MVKHFTLRHPVKRGAPEDYVWGTIDDGVNEPTLNLVMKKMDGTEATLRLAYDGERVYVVAREGDDVKVMHIMVQPLEPENENFPLL